MSPKIYEIIISTSGFFHLLIFSRIFFKVGEKSFFASVDLRGLLKENIQP